MIKEINILIYREDHTPGFQFFTGLIEKLYVVKLPKTNIGVRKIDFYFTDFNDQKITNNELIINLVFDFEMFDSLENNHSKKKYILEAFHYALIAFCKENSFDFSPFTIAYENTLEEHLTYSWWTLAKNEPSPNKEYFINLYHKVDVKEYEIYEVLFGSDMKEICRRICFKDVLPIFKIEQLTWINESEYFYKFHNASKLIQVSILSMLKNEKYNVEISTSLFFKK
jgi:hypothetical protein